MVIRYVISNIDKDGSRTMTYPPQQGRNTRGSKKEAEQDLQDLLSANTEERLAGIFGTQAIGTFEVSAMECYDGHFDPVGCYVRENLNPGQVCLTGWIKETLERINKQHGGKNGLST